MIVTNKQMWDSEFSYCNAVEGFSKIRQSRIRLLISGKQYNIQIVTIDKDYYNGLSNSIAADVFE